MADAVITAPLNQGADAKKLPKKEVTVSGEVVFEGSNEHLALTKEFDPEKKYMFELAAQIPEPELPVIDMRTHRPLPHDKFSKFRNITYTSQIVWKGQRRGVRYYDGCDSIFIDRQPKDKESIDQFIKSTKRRNFVEGKFGCYGEDRMLLIYLNICSWNGNSPFKTRTSPTVFVSKNPDKAATEIDNKLDLIEKAMQLAREASEDKMRIHSDYLGISHIDYDSGNDLSLKEIRALYREEASRRPQKFIESYGNKAIEIKFYIQKALETGLINNTFNPNKATWRGSNNVICDISGLKTHESIAEKLFEFSQFEEGEDFVIQLKALFNN